MSKAEKLNIRFTGVETRKSLDYDMDCMGAYIVVNGNHHMHLRQCVRPGAKMFVLDAKAIRDINRLMKKQRKEAAP